MFCVICPLRRGKDYRCDRHNVYTPALRALEHGYCTYPEAIKEYYLDPTKFADPVDSAVEPPTAKGTTTAAD
jgi:hypothetical protein